MMQTGRRLDYPDIAKGLAIIAVLLGHETTFLMQGGAGAVVVPAYMRFVMAFVDQFHMPVFFLIAGVFAKNSVRPGLASMKKITVRLMIPYFLWIFLTTLALSVMQPLTGKDPQWHRFFESPVYSFGQFWFLYALFLAELLYWLLLTLIPEARTVCRVMAGISVLMILLYPHLTAPEQITGLFRNLIFFTAGLSFSEYLKSLKTERKRLQVFTAAAVFLASVTVIGSEWIAEEHIYWIIRTVGGMAGAFTCIFVSCMIAECTERNILKRILLYCGEISLEIYCLNPFLTEPGRMIAQRIFGSGFLWLRPILITAAVTAVTGILMYMIPRTNILRRLAFGRI